MNFMNRRNWINLEDESMSLRMTTESQFMEIQLSMMKTMMKKMMMTLGMSMRMMGS